MAYFRLCFDQLNEDDPSPMVIDLPLNKDHTFTKTIPVSGWWGIPKTNNWMMPFVLRTDGTADFGGVPEETDANRFSKLDLRSKPLDLNEQFYLIELDGEVQTFKLTKRIPLE